MGLDLYTASRRHVRVGSYSGVHYYRRALIEAFVAAAPAEEAAIARTWMREVADGRDSTGVAYDMMPDAVGSRWTTELRGLFRFVNHSDCDGEHAVGDLPDIVAMMRLCASKMPDRMAEWHASIQAFFETSERLQEAIEYA